EDEDFEIVRKGVIQIKVFSQKYDAFSPWQTKKIQASTGTGFLITKDKILTNAHVISNAKFIQVQRYNQTTWYEVDVLHVAHDCDLAILKAKDPNFYEDSHVFELGDIPELNSPISVVGYPIGGDKISVTRGIVSRKEQSTYAHSQVDSHLVIQVDAAINPGNSGGPAIQGDKVVGVAFQVATRGENIGYLIPTTVVKYFLKDVEDGKYDGYVELGIRTLNSYNETFRKLMNIPDKMDGVFVTKVLRGGSAEGHLKVDDLLTEIDGLSIGRNGTVLFDKDARVDFVEIVDNKHSGEIIYLKVFREGKLIDINFPAKKMLQFNFMRHQYNEPYNYFQIGGLVFQPVSRDLIGEWLKNRETQGGSQLLFRFFHFIEEDLGEGKFKEDIVFYRRLAHPVNSSAQYYVNLILESVNGIEVKDINHLKEICSNSKETFFRFKFRDVQSPLVLKSEALLKANKDIQKLYGIITKKDPAKKNKQQNGKS
ncbi:MAG: trypsin-like peptidase domain-containing protein, partial [Leptospiraceae bacterium]|nr:trypsin-like peptidase domain-containing protein [Leptospiraceae bacterium]